MSDVTNITVIDNGPIVIKNTFELFDGEGNSFTPKKDTISICRCGASTNQPFCNGSHHKIDFQSIVRALKESS
ncbi:MAG: CDGSH iron-sulfur domain-containing protein [Phormidesmis sp.]